MNLHSKKVGKEKERMRKKPLNGKVNYYFLPILSLNLLKIVQYFIKFRNGAKYLKLVQTQ